MNNYEVTFTANAPGKFAGSCFRRKRFEPLIKLIMSQYMPFVLEYPAKITVCGNVCGIHHIKFSSQTQTFKFVEPYWKSASNSYTFSSIFAEENNKDGVTKKVMNIHKSGIYYFGNVLLGQSLVTSVSPFQSFTLNFNQERAVDVKHYNNCTKLIYQMRDFLKSYSTFTYFDVVSVILSVFNVHIKDIDILDIEGVIKITNGKLVMANSYFEDAIVELYFQDGKCGTICRSTRSVLTASFNGSFTFFGEFASSTEKDAELSASLEKIEKAKKYMGFIHNN